MKRRGHERVQVSLVVGYPAGLYHGAPRVLQLERSTEFDDPLLEIRRRIHRPIYAELEKALRKPQRAATSGRRETEKRSKIEKENTIE